MVKATKAGLIGLWRIDRHIADARGPDAVFSGRGTFEAAPEDPALLTWREVGTLRIGEAPPMAADRSYRWQFTAQGHVHISFEDGRPFHDFDPHEAAPSARHDCPPDIYDVSYDFSRDEEWRSVWGDMCLVMLTDWA